MSSPYLSKVFELKCILTLAFSKHEYYEIYFTLCRVFRSLRGLNKVLTCMPLVAVIFTSLVAQRFLTAVLENAKFSLIDIDAWAPDPWQINKHEITPHRDLHLPNIDTLTLLYFLPASRHLGRRHSLSVLLYIINSLLRYRLRPLFTSFPSPRYLDLCINSLGHETSNTFTSAYTNLEHVVRHFDYESDHFCVYFHCV